MIDKQLLDDLQAQWEAQESQEQPESPSRLPLDSLSLLPSLYQSRADYEDSSGVVDTHHVAVLVASLKGSRNTDLDPIKVLRVGTRNIVVDGHHRLKAYRNSGHQDIPVEFISGGPKHALLVAGAENKKTRLTMHAAERSERAWTLVITGLFSKQEIVDGSGASGTTVSNMRRKWNALVKAQKEIPDSWREANRRAGDWDPEWSKQMAQKWAKGITGAVGAPGSFKTEGKLCILGDALIEWSPRLAQSLALYLVGTLGLTDEAEAIEEERRQEDEEFPYGF